MAKFFTLLLLLYRTSVNADFNEAETNPKRRQHEVRLQIKNIGIGTKSQQALKLQHEQIKNGRKTACRQPRKAEKQRRFELKQKKKKEKHRGK